MSAGAAALGASCVLSAACSSPTAPAPNGALRLSTHDLELPEVEVPLARVHFLHDVTGLGGLERGLVTAGQTALVVDPAHPSEALVVPLPAALGRALAHDEVGERWAVADHLGLSIISAEGEVSSVALPALADGFPFARHVARVGTEWWVIGSTFDRVSDEGTVVSSDLVVPTFGCAAAADDGGAWIALGVSTGGLDIFAVDSVGTPTGEPPARWSIALPDRGCSFRMLGDQLFACGTSMGWMAGPYETCASAFGATDDRPSLRLQPQAAGAWDGTGYVHASTEHGLDERYGLARFVPSSGLIDRSAPPPDEHTIRGVLAIGGRLWALSVRGPLLFLGEVTPELEVPATTAIALAATSPPWASQSVRWRQHSELGLLGAWQSDQRAAGPQVIARRCGLLRAPFEGDLAIRESPELCDAAVAIVGQDALVVGGGSIRPVLPDLSLGTAVSVAPTTPLLASGPSALFGEITCQELLGCSMSLATFDGTSVSETTSSVVCPTTPRVLATADTSWGFVIALRCEDTVRAVTLDTRGHDLGVVTLGTARWGGFGPIDDQDVLVHRVGARLVVTVQSSTGALHLFSYLDGVAEEPLQVPGPSSVWPGSELLYLPEARRVVDLEARTTESAPWLATIGEHGGQRVPAGDGSIWVTGPPIERWELRAPSAP